MSDELSRLYYNLAHTEGMYSLEKLYDFQVETFVLNKSQIIEEMNPPKLERCGMLFHPRIQFPVLKLAITTYEEHFDTRKAVSVMPLYDKICKQIDLSFDVQGRKDQVESLSVKMFGQTFLLTGHCLSPMRDKAPTSMEIDLSPWFGV